jgi:glycogen debranching enzyme
MQHPAAGSQEEPGHGFTPEAPAQFQVAASSLQERRLRTMKQGETFGVFDHHGDALAGSGSPEGLYHRDTRYLSHFRLSLGGQRPLLLSSTVRDDNAVLICDLTNSESLDESEGGLLAQDLIHVRRTRFLWTGRVFERLALHNYDIRTRSVRLKIEFGADFADIFEVRGTPRAARGEMRAPVVKASSVTLSYLGLDHRERETHLQFEPAPDQIDSESAAFSIQLAPGERRTLFAAIRCGVGRDARSPRRAFFSCLREARKSLRQSASRAASISTSNEVFNETVRRAVSDLYMLVTDTPYGPFPYAGIPWFSTVFGRDALITALQTLWLDPEIAHGVLRYLAAHQATDIDKTADAEPGKILHEMRFGEMAELREVPFQRYYGSVDATPLFVILAGAYLQRTDDVATLLEIWGNVEAALTWLGSYGDRDGDGFVEYGRRNVSGLINQGWKDSYDSIFHEDGTLAAGPVAVVEVQAYAYGAWRAAAAIAARLQRPATEIAAFTRRADDLQRRFDEAFFDESLGTYVLALDGDKRPCRVRSSNAGHALLTGIAPPERAEQVIRDLMQPSSFTGWGIRTVPSTEARYNPMSYHNGSVWPHDNALIAAGMARYGYRKEATQILKGLFEASTYIDLKRLPELFCGIPRLRSHGPTFYPVACSPQAWAAGATLSLVQSCLGLTLDPEAGQVLFDRPTLPDFIESATLRHIRLPQGQIDVALVKAGEHVAVHLVARVGNVSALVRT